MRKRVGRGRQHVAGLRPTMRVREDSSVGDDKCPLCDKPIKGAKGAKVYHWTCLYESMKEIREKYSKPV